jgi:hypothetical protein
MKVDRSMLEAYEHGTLFFSDTVVLFQYLLDSDLLWSFSRGKAMYLTTANELLKRGYVKLKSP